VLLSWLQLGLRHPHESPSKLIAEEIARRFANSKMKCINWNLDRERLTS